MFGIFTDLLFQENPAATDITSKDLTFSASECQSQEACGGVQRCKEQGFFSQGSGTLLADLSGNCI
jgi:hypothetical protein